ncbi:MAG: hypothetical protein RR585_00975 [Coprobacillus sp.]
MGFFSKKTKIDYDVLFKEQYKSINQLMMQANEELDFVIKQSLLEVVVEKYNQLLECIDNGATFDKEHFISLQQSAIKELESIKSINNG